jgi:FixJ family two-component response regulator
VEKTPVIAIVDDDGSIRDATEDFIRWLGYTAVSFATAEEFLRSGVIENAACLIADVQMPGMSGVDLQERLIADGRHTPIIFVTAFPDEKVRARALQAGAYGFLSKPFSDVSLMEHLDRALSLRST